MDLIERLEVIVAGVRREHAPDLRTSIFDVDIVEDGDVVVVVGATSEPAAEEALQRRVGSLDVEQPVRVEIARLPQLGSDSPHALVTSAVAPMLAGPYVSDAPVSQAVLGHRLLIFREHGRFLQCRSVDGYLGWVHRGYVRQLDEMEARGWEAGAGGEICMSLGARVVDEAGDVLVRLPWGARVLGLGGDRVRLPDGVIGRAVGSLIPESERDRRFPPRGEDVIATAMLWQGAPYVWAGVTRAGIDCSGLVQAVLRTHGIEMPRDSDLQAMLGEPVSPGHGFENLCPGDLLYFAEEGGRITHAAFALGGSKIFHAAISNGGVGRNDLNGELGFEQELRRIFISARRVLPEGC